MNIFSKSITWIKTRSLLIKIVMVLLLGGLVWWGYRTITKTETTQAIIQTSTVEKGTLVVALSSSGSVASTNSRSVTSNATGVVKKLFVKNGDVVKSGQALFELDLDQDAKQSYAQASASYQSAKNILTSAQSAYYTIQADMLGSWDDFKTLSESDSYEDPNSENRTLPEFMISQNTWLSSEAKYKQQQAVVTQAQTALNSASLSLREASPTIYAPIAGTLNGLSLQVGSVLNTNSSSSSTSTTTSNSTKLASIITDAKPTIAIDLTEIDVTKVAVGNKVTITADALPDMTFTGSVVSIDRVGSVSSGVTSYPAVIALDTDVPNLLANMSVTANIITQTKNDVLLVPSSAVKTQNGQSTVQVMKDDVPIATTVVVGLSSDSQTEIVSGLKEGDVIATTATATTTGTSTTGTAKTGTTSVFSGIGGGTGMRIPH
jgi:multidrug efflux pump subunit AcrA (membrane-fusion protein)